MNLRAHLLLACGSVVAACSSSSAPDAPQDPPAPVLIGATSSALSAPPANTIWFTSLCVPTDNQVITPGRDYSFYYNLFTSTGTGSVVDYWTAQSYGRQTFAFSTMTPQWVSTGHTVAWHQAQTRETNIETCVNAGLNATNYGLNYYNYIAVYNGQIDEGSIGSTIQGKQVPAVIIDAYSPESGVLHEMGHGFGLGHSYDDQGVQYGDPFDLMSAMAINTYKGNYCVTPGAWYACDNGPGLNEWSRWQLGWLQPQQRKMWWPATAGAPLRTQNVVLGARNEAPGAAPQVLYVPASAKYMYTVEWIVPDNYDMDNLVAASSPQQTPRVPSSTLLIHKINYGDATTYLVKEAGGVQTAVGTPFFDAATGVHIQLTGSQWPNATVQVTVDNSNTLWASGAGTGAPPADSAKVWWQGIFPVAGDQWGYEPLSGGYDPTVGNLTPCRAWYGGGVHLGKASLSSRWCFFPWGGREIAASPAFEIVSLQPGAQGTWVSGSNGDLPPNALAAGFDGGNTLYVCRAQINGNWTPGKFIWGSCDVSWAGTENFFSSYQVLTVQ